MLEKDPRTYKIIGSAMEVHKQLGCGFLEVVYQEAFAIELQTQGVKFSREVNLPVFYKEHRLNTFYRADFICFDSIIVELKALNKIGRIEEAQILNYLKATGFEIGLLINFGAPSLEYKRYIYTKK